MAERRTLFQCEECQKWFFSMEVFGRHACCMNASLQNTVVADEFADAGIVLHENTAEEEIDSQIVHTFRFWSGLQNTAVADEFADAGIVLHENTAEEEIDSQIAVQQEVQQSLSWSRDATLLLISQYKSKQSQIETGKMRKNKAFAEISETLKEHGYYFNPEQCASRLKTITHAYKNIKDHNNKSGNSRKSYEYEKELDDLYEKRPNIQPEFVLSTSSATQQKVKDDVPENGPETEVTRNKRATSDSETAGNPSAQKSRKTQVSEVITFIQDLTKNQDERHKNEQMKREERHKDKMSVFRELIDVLKEKK